MQSRRFLRCALELTSQTTGPSSVTMMSTPAKSAPTASHAMIASSATSVDGSHGEMVPPMVALDLKSPSGVVLLMAATALPPTTSTLMSVPPHSMYLWRILGTNGPPSSDASSSLVLARWTCCPNDP